MRRMLDPKEAGGLPSTIEFDKDGNRKVSKDLGVDGKLTLKSLISSTNPDGDITKELGGGAANKLYKHTINFWSSTYGTVYLTIYNTSNEQINSESKFKPAMEKFGYAMASGYISDGTVPFNVFYAYRSASDHKVRAIGYRINSEGKMATWSTDLDYHFSSIEDDVKEIR